MYYLWFDTETGGLDPGIHSLLTAYFAICDRNLKLIDDLYLQLKPEDISKICVTSEAMNINKINLEQHLKDPSTITYKEGAEKLLNFLEKNKKKMKETEEFKKKRKFFMPCGHNIGFDKDFIWKNMIDRSEWEKITSHRNIDTSNICNFLKDVDIFPEELGKLTSIVEYLGLPMREAHNAKDDVLMNIEVYKGIVALMKKKKADVVNNSNNSLLQIIEM